LGLALIKRIIDLHHWQISAESKEGESSTFIVSFSQKRAAMHGVK